MLNAIIMAAAVIAGMVVHFILFRSAQGLTHSVNSVWADSAIQHCNRPVKFVLPLLMLSFCLPLLSLSPAAMAFLKHALALGTIVAIACLLMRLTDVFEDTLVEKFKTDTHDNLEARKIHTQLQVFKKIINVIIWVVSISAILMTFDRVRQLGASILASAGIAGIIIGFAAQRSLATVMAGLQIALTQPIRIDDVVIVEGEWGRIEEITLTYVVVRIWDLRRLILPITYFTEKPFQNWTRVTADILGTVFIYVDYSVPVQEIREALERILKASENWDGRVSGVQVTDSTEKTVAVRALMSATDASKAWDLRCEVREKLISFVRDNYPDALPKMRAEIMPPVTDSKNG